MWDIEVTDDFLEWWHGLEIDQQEALTDRIDLPGEWSGSGTPGGGPHPRVATHNMKELRASKGGALRVLFMFDPRRSVILLLGGDKTGEWDTWYEWRSRLPMTSTTCTWPNFETKG